MHLKSQVLRYRLAQVKRSSMGWNLRGTRSSLVTIACLLPVARLLQECGMFFCGFEVRQKPKTVSSSYTYTATDDNASRDA